MMMMMMTAANAAAAACLMVDALRRNRYLLRPWSLNEIMSLRTVDPLLRCAALRNQNLRTYTPPLESV